MSRQKELIGAFTNQLFLLSMLRTRSRQPSNSRLQSLRADGHKDCVWIRFHKMLFWGECNGTTPFCNLLQYVWHGNMTFVT
jgi:hypothetical protein